MAGGGLGQASHGFEGDCSKLVGFASAHEANPFYINGRTLQTKFVRWRVEFRTFRVLSWPSPSYSCGRRMGINGEEAREKRFHGFLKSEVVPLGANGLAL